MARLNLNFHETTERHDPTKGEIRQLAGIALSIEATVKALFVYASDAAGGVERTKDLDMVCMGACNALELLIDPIVEYMNEYAGQEPCPEGKPE